MRIMKEYDERRNEILDTAERLFYTKGYEKCTVNDILNELSIAKGTLYYYFKSKQEVLDAIVSRYTELAINRGKEVLQQAELSPPEKLLNLFMAMRVTDKTGHEVLNEVHKPENAQLHQKSLTAIVTAMSPLLAEVIEEGIESGVWRCKYPLEYMQIFLAATISLTDEGMFALDADAQVKLLIALISLLEKMLDVPEDTFMQLYNQIWGNADENI